MLARMTARPSRMTAWARRGFVAAGVMGLSLTLQTPTAHAEACATGEGVTIVIESEAIEAAHCVDRSGVTALEALHTAGYRTEGTTRYGSAVLCRVDGFPAPEDESCVDMPAASRFWSVHHAMDGDDDWTLARESVSSLVVEPGDWLGFSFGDGEAPSLRPGADQGSANTEADESTTDVPQADGTPWGMIVALSAVIVIGTAAFVVTRRRPTAA